MVGRITSIDGVLRHPSNGINVIIIGAGVGGLATALECWRKGCEVVVLEQAPRLSPLGDYFTISPSALTTLKEYPGMFADYHERTYNCSIHLLTASGVSLKSSIPEWKLQRAATAAPEVDVSFLTRRPVYAQMLLNQLDRLGVPVHFGQKAVKVHEDKDSVTVTTSSGEAFVGDICIVASGVGTKLDGFPLPVIEEVLDSGYAVARIAFPRCVIKPGSPADKLLINVEEDPQFRTYVGKDVHLILFLTKDWVAWTFTHKNDGSAKESWHNLVDAMDIISEIRKSGEDWDPAVINFLEQTPAEVIDWSLRFRNPVEKWTSDAGRLLRLGDSAHPFLPTAGNGAVQALEDAVSIGECLSIGGKANATWSTKVHNRLRFERTSVLQQTGVVNREEIHHVDPDALMNQNGSPDVGFFRLGRWVWGHNPEIYARDNFGACLASLQDGHPFENTNLPPGHVYKPWTMASENDRVLKGEPSDLKQNGDWSV